MGFNISGLVLNKNFEENFEDLQIVLGWNLEKQSIIDFETASSNWKESGICDVLFSSKGTLIFLNMDLCTDPFPVRNANTFTFALSETSMAFNLNFCEDGLEKRSIMEVHGKRIRNSGKPLSVEAKSDDTPDIVWNQIEMMLGKSYWSIPPDEKVVRYKFVKGKKKINQSTYYDKVDSNGQTKLQKIQSNPPRTLNDVYAEKQKIKTKEKVTDNGSSFSNEKIAGNRISHEPRKKWWMFWQKDSKQDQTKVSIVPQPTAKNGHSIPPSAGQSEPPAADQSEHSGADESEPLKRSILFECCDGFFCKKDHGEQTDRYAKGKKDLQIVRRGGQQATDQQGTWHLPQHGGQVHRVLQVLQADALRGLGDDPGGDPQALQGGPKAQERTAEDLGAVLPLF